MSKEMSKTLDFRLSEGLPTMKFDLVSSFRLNPLPPMKASKACSDGMDASPRQRVLNGRRLQERRPLAVTASLCQSGDVESNHLNRRVRDEA